MKSIGISMIGSGFMGKLHTLALASYPVYFFPPDVEVRRECVAVHDEKNGRRDMQRYGFARHTSDWRSLLADEKTDAIIINAPNYLHREMAVEAVRAGKHVFCEKPLGMTGEEAYEMYLEAKKAGVVAACGHNNRSLAAIRQMKLLIDQGKLGKIYSIQMRYIQSWGMGEEHPMQWRFDSKLAGSGTLGDTGSHAIDIGRYLLGNVRRVTAMEKTIVEERNVYESALLSRATAGERKGTKRVDVDDDVKALVEFENGTAGILWSSRFCLGHEDTLDIEVYGSRGSARFSRERPNELEYYTREDDSSLRGFRKIKMGPDNPNGDFWSMADLGIGYVEQKCTEYRDFFAAIAKEDPSLAACDFYDGFKVCQFIDAVQESARTGNWVSVDNRM